MLVLFSACLLVICCGAVCLRDAELAWELYQRDCQLIGITPPRLRNWQSRVHQVGHALIGLGLLGILVSMGL